MKEIKINDIQAQDIAIAILALAADDYRKAIKEQMQSERVLNEMLLFFGSGWAQYLAGNVDIKAVFEKVTEETLKDIEDGDKYIDLVKAIKRQQTKNIASRIRVFSDKGVFYILNLTDGNKKEAQRKALELLKELEKEG